MYKYINGQVKQLNIYCMTHELVHTRIHVHVHIQMCSGMYKYMYMYSIIIHLSIVSVWNFQVSVISGLTPHLTKKEPDTAVG